jgi:hypothetical protein
MQTTNFPGRARHSVRAVGCQPTRSADRGLPALPAVLAPVAAGQSCLISLASALSRIFLMKLAEAGGFKANA